MKTFNILNIKDVIELWKRIAENLNFWLIGIKNKRILIIFFNFDEPCPGIIQNCDEMRRQFQADIERVGKMSTCTSCSFVFIKNDYIKKILKSLKL